MPTQLAGRTACTENDVRRALDAVLDPELDEPITDLGFVRSVRVGAGSVEVHLRLPTSFCSPNFAFLMASDAKDALVGLAPRVVVELDDHHDSELINTGLAADAGYKGTFGGEAEHSLDELRLTFRRKAHTAAMERALTHLLAVASGLGEQDLHRITLDDLPDGHEKRTLLSRRADVGLGVAGTDRVLVDEQGRPCAAERATITLRRARSVRISVDGNAHFCRGLLTTRYPGSEADQSPRVDDAGGATRTLLPLLVPTVSAWERTTT